MIWVKELYSRLENFLLHPIYSRKAKKLAKKFGSTTGMHCYACRYFESDEEIGVWDACFNNKSPYHYTGTNDGISRQSGALIPSICKEFMPKNPSLKIILIRFIYRL